jgi:hypothetical protein
MKAQIYFFAGNKFNNLRYQHLEEIPAWQVWDVAQEIFNEGLNVMITHSSHGGEQKVILYVDNKNFKQR